MTATGRLAEALVRTITGPMWHGPALGELLSGVSHDEAGARPVAGAHSIWELVAHVTTWAEVPRLRVAGDPRLDVRPDEDWPPVPAPSAAAWKATVERMERAYRALANDIAALDDRVLDEKVAGHNYSVRTMVHGVIEHGTYHAGQIALLKKAVSGAMTPGQT